jgi:hypothetical protein
VQAGENREQRELCHQRERVDERDGKVKFGKVKKAVKIKIKLKSSLS